MLKHRAVLEIDLDDRTGVFPLREDLDESAEIDRTFLVGSRGQYLQELWNVGSELTDLVDGPADGSRRQGYHVDGGAGRHVHTLSFKAAKEDPWGDNSFDPKFDAAGEGPLTQKQVLEYYISQSRTDSAGQCRLYRGEYTDGTYADEPGAFGHPLTVAIADATLQREPDDPSRFSGTLTLVRTSTVPDVDALLEDAAETLEGIIPDW